MVLQKTAVSLMSLPIASGQTTQLTLAKYASNLFFMLIRKKRVLIINKKQVENVAPFWSDPRKSRSDPKKCSFGVFAI